MIDSSTESFEGELQPQRFCQQKNSFDKPLCSIADRRDLILNVLLDISSTFLHIGFTFFIVIKYA